MLPADFEDGVAVMRFTSKSESPLSFSVSYGDIFVKSEKLRPGIFSDVSVAHANYKAIKALQVSGVIEIPRRCVTNMYPITNINFDYPVIKMEEDNAST